MTRRFFVYWLCLGVFVLPAVSQTSSTQQGNASAFLAQVANAFSATKPVANVQLAGSANWYAGSLEDVGTATLTASATGAATMQLSLATKGSWTESQSDFGANTSCQWTANDGAVHEGNYLNCIRPVTWFLPSISLQPTLIPAGIGVADLGTGVIGQESCRHIQSQAVLSQITGKLLLPRSVAASTTDIGVDPSTLLPSILQYQMRLDDDGHTEMIVEIHYSNYQSVGGVTIPFLIQRYINGTLQLEIHVNSAQIS